MRADTVPGLFFREAPRRAGRVAMRRKRLGVWEETTWQAYAEEVRAVALGLAALGVERGQRVAIASENRPEWLVFDLAAQSAGAVPVGIYTTNSVAECEYIVAHSESVVYLAEDEEQLDKVLAFRERTPSLTKIVVVDPKGLRHFTDPMVMTFAELLDVGRKLEVREPGLFERRLEAVEPDDLGTIVYTSGTTGPPKGAMLSHRTALWTSELIGKVEPTSDRDELLSYLPLSHVAQRLLSVFDHVRYGYVVNFVENLDTFPADLREVRPTQFFGPPRVWEKFYSAITLNVAEATPFKRTCYRAALGVGLRHARVTLGRRRASPLLRLTAALARETVGRRLRAHLGLDRVTFAFTGAAPISPDLIYFFHALGVGLREVYGQTENCGPATIHRGDDVMPGTVGTPFPGVEVRIADDGEILLRGGNIFQGYFKNPEATADTLRGGWLHTGDVGNLTPEGHLRITDRKKDLIITGGGKNIAPQNIENQLKFSPYIADAVVIGDRRKYLTALVIIDEENCIRYAQDRRIPFSTYADLTQHLEIRRLVQAEVDRINRDLARVETIKKFRVLDKQLDPEDGDVTPTMKVKRKAIAERYRTLIEEMYRE
jgi:long-chain acyl-CoA synthetase